MINYTIDTLMSRLGCERFPERWREIYDDAKSILENDENPLLHPEYYDELHEKYLVLENTLEYYKRAAAGIAESEELSLFFCLLCRALKDRATIQRDIAQMQIPPVPEGEDSLPYNMLTGLAMCQAIPTFYEHMRKIGLPDDIIYPSLRLPEDSVASYIRRNGGKAGFANFDWYQLYYDARLYRFDGLTMEFPATFPGIATVYQGRNGEIVSLATNVRCHRDGFPLGSKYYEDEEGSFTAVTETTSDAYVGHPYDQHGRISRDRIALKKDEWSLLFSGGDKMISIHIPTGAKFTPEAIDASIERTKAILREHFPKYDYKIFFCGSWMLDPQIPRLLGEEKNVPKFCRRFHPLCVKDAGRAVFTFVFQKPNSDFEVSELPENTSLERALKNHYLSGKAIYETFGFFLP